MRSTAVPCLHLYLFNLFIISCGGSESSTPPPNIPIAPTTPIPEVPEITVGAPSIPLASSTGTVTYTVTYTNASTITLTTANISLNKTGDANCSIEVSGSGTVNRIVTLTSCAGNGTMGITIAAGTASNSAGTLAGASSASATFSVANTSDPFDLKRGDINRDGIPDLVVRGANGVGVFAMLINSNLQTEQSLISPIDSTLASNWVVVGVHDFDNDNHTDLLLFNNISTDRSLKLLKLGGATGTSILSEIPLMQNGNPMTLPAGTEIFGVADLDSDSDVDLVLRNTTSGAVILYEMTGVSFQQSNQVAEIPGTNYDIVAAHETLIPQQTDLFFQLKTPEANSGGQDVIRWRLNTFNRTESVPVTLASGGNLQTAAAWKLMTARRYPGDTDPSLIVVNSTTGQMQRYMLEGSKYVGSETFIYSLGTLYDLATD